MILYLVDKCRRVLQSHAHGYALGLYLDAFGCQIAVDIAGGMAGGQDDGAEEGFLRGEG